MMWAVIVGLPCYGVAVSAERLLGLGLQVSIRFSRPSGPSEIPTVAFGPLQTSTSDPRTPRARY
jgi:hypothetical protein